MESFLLDWHRLTDDQDVTMVDEVKENIFYKKIKNHSPALRGWIEAYDRAKPGHPDGTYAYLLDAMTTHIERQRMEAHVEKLASQTLANAKGDKTPKVNKALISKLACQCRFHLQPNGCNNPDTCTLGEHDPKLQGMGKKGKGAGKGGKTGKGPDNATYPPTGGANTGGKGADGKKGGKGKKQPIDPANLPPPGSPDSVVDKDGSMFCHKFIDGKCNDPNCKRSHKPATKGALSMKEHFQSKFRGKGGDSGAESGAEGGKGAKGRGRGRGGKAAADDKPEG